MFASHHPTFPPKYQFLKITDVVVYRLKILRLDFLLPGSKEYDIYATTKNILH